MTQRINQPECEASPTGTHLAVRDKMDMVCTWCGIILYLLDRPSSWVRAQKDFAQAQRSKLVDPPDPKETNEEIDARMEQQLRDRGWNWPDQPGRDLSTRETWKCLADGCERLAYDDGTDPDLVALDHCVEHDPIMTATERQDRWGTN